MDCTNSPSMEILNITLPKIKALFQKLPYQSYLSGFQQWISDRMSDWEKTALRIGIVGITSAGKSTFVNALAGEDILPRGAQPTSGLLVVCRRNTPRKLDIHFKDGNQTQYVNEECTPEWVKRYADEQENPNNEQNVRELQLSLPGLMIPERYDLIDSPGLDAFGLQGHEELTLRTLVPMVDVVLFLTTTKSTSDRENLKALSKICKEAKPVIVVQTHKDSVEPRYAKGGKITESAEQVLEKHYLRVKQLLEQTIVLKDTPIIQVSSIQALHSRLQNIAFSNDPTELAGWQESGFGQITQVLTELYQKLSHSIATKRLHMICKEIQQVMERVRADYNMARGQFKEAEDYKEGELSKLEEIQNSIPTEKTPNFPNTAELQQKIVGIKGDFLTELDIREDDTLENLSMEVRDQIKQIENGFFEQADIIDAQLQKIATDLGIDISTAKADEYQQHPSLPELRKYEQLVKVEMIQEVGMVGRAKRLFGKILNKEWGLREKEVRQTKIDREALRDDLMEYYSVYQLKLSNYLKRWQHHWVNSVASILSTITQRRDDLYQQPVKVDPEPYHILLDDIRHLRDWLEAQLAEPESTEEESSVKLEFDLHTPIIKTPPPPRVEEKNIPELKFLTPLLDACRILHFNRRTHRFWQICQGISAKFRQPCIPENRPQILISTPFSQELMDYLTWISDLPSVEEKVLENQVVVYGLPEDPIWAEVYLPVTTLNQVAPNTRESWFASRNVIVLFHDNLLYSEQGLNFFQELSVQSDVIFRVVDLHQIGHERKRLDELPGKDVLHKHKNKIAYLGMGPQQLIKSDQTVEIFRSYISLKNPPGFGLCPMLLADCDDFMTSLLWLGTGLIQNQSVTQELEAMSILQKNLPHFTQGRETWIRNLFHSVRELRAEEAFYQRLNE